MHMHEPYHSHLHWDIVKLGGDLRLDQNHDSFSQLADKRARCMAPDSRMSECSIVIKYQAISSAH